MAYSCMLVCFGSGERDYQAHIAAAWKTHFCFQQGTGGRTPECNRPWAEQPTPILGPLRYRVHVYYPRLRADHLLLCSCKATRVSNPANHFAFVKYKIPSLGLPATVQAFRSVVSSSQHPSVFLVSSTLQLRPLIYRFTRQGRSREANALHASA
ncbi:uncharacterized protein BDW70DRAFT_16123 [Aspergillus foveolatus]|uniref:uncharacterized protein n=1 Tax=Aspergillus foveolatus TaxID=210207 RepID=UPI003CCCAE33